MSSFPTGLQHVALYLRKSRADLEAEAHGEGETLSKHRKALFSLAKKFLYTIEDVFEELVSGERIIDRPEIQKLLQNVQGGKYDAVLCMDVDRLGRGNMIDQGLIQEAFKASQTLIITPRKVYDLDDEHDEEWTEFEAFMARRELKIITRRMQRGRRMSAQDGKSITKSPPFGYLRDENFRLHPNSETAHIVKRIFEWQSEGYGIVRIANRLTDMRIPSPTGLTWGRTTVRNILNNEVYLGKIIWGKNKFTKAAPRTYTKTPLPRDRWIVVENAHEPLITEELWEKAQRMKAQMTAHVKQDLTLKNPFAGVLRCKECGKTMRLQTRTTRAHGRGQDTLKCMTHSCDARQTLLRIVEERILYDVEVMMQNAPKTDVQRKREVRDNLEVAKRKLTVIEGELKKLQVQKGNLFDLLEQSVYTVEVFMERSKAIADRESALDEELKQVKEEIQAHESNAASQHEIIPSLSKMIKEYGRAKDILTKNKILKSVFDHIDYARRKEWDKDRGCELDYYFRV